MIPEAVKTLLGIIPKAVKTVLAKILETALVAIEVAEIQVSLTP